MYRTLERIAVWSLGFRRPLWGLVGLAFIAVAIVLFSSESIDRIVGSSPTASAIGLLAFFAIVGIGGLAAQVLHVQHWFGTREGHVAPPLIYRVYPYARPAIVLLIVLGGVPAIGCLYIFFHFVSVMPK